MRIKQHESSKLLTSFSHDRGRRNKLSSSETFSIVVIASLYKNE